jgi:hypothetical protein
MNFLELIGLLTLIFFGIYLLNEFLNAQKEYQRKLDEALRANKEAAAEYLELEEKKREREKKEELVAKAIIEKQNAFFNKWKNVDPEEEYLIRVGKIKSPLFYPKYSEIPLWSIISEKKKPPQVDDIIKNYGIPIKTLELLYRGYSNEYYNDERRFTDEELKMEYLESWLPENSVEKAKLNLQLIVLNRIIQTLEELKQIGIAKNKTPVYKQSELD